ncbi:methyltransferase family protein [Nocardioides albertanoniae]|uniref:Methyltransferase family protein n=1 Tax=Nocardioides albertanoniae TaxID=1175486 RepID=A0A543A640_9ACTN|nr:class I SAM-dependent methyltransferase [Nocardioides albertanoniae]TQL68038.1 methyltransferase family protein [Nocardioides albertanoniae]
MRLDPESSRQIEANRANWDARTPIHVASAFYGIDGSRPAESWFADYEWSDLGELAGREIVHLQCHLGTETIAFARRGALTHGLDISPEAVAAARRIAADADVRIDYHAADVHDAVDVLGEGRFDIVYTGKGAVCYLPDIDLWARVVHDLLKPGGFVYLAEFHPLLDALGEVPEQGREDSLELRHDYLSGRGAIAKDSTHTYTDGPALESATTAYEWRHGVGEMVTALAAAGLRIEVVREDERLPWPRFPSMEAGEDGWFRLPEQAPRIPLLYAIRARRPTLL